MDIMTDTEAVERTKQGWDFVFQQGAMIALMPIEDWLTAFDKAEIIGPFLDPTLYREGLYSGKPKLIREVLEGAMVFKRAILKAQKEVAENPRLRK
jgi:hypothetical protein